jgi:hypothetical protein
MNKQVLLVVPWWKKPRFFDRSPDAYVVHPYEDLPLKDFVVDMIMMDVELKHEWDELMDEWFHEDVVPCLGAEGGYIAWCREQEQETPDAPT